MKRFLSIVFTIVMCASLVLPSFAANDKQATLYSDSSYNNVIGGVSFIERAGMRAELEELISQEVVPSGIIFDVDSDLNVTNENGGRLGYTLREAAIIIDEIARPIVRVTDEYTARAVCTFFKYSGVYDFFIMSDSADLLKICRKEYPMGGTIFDMTESVIDVPTTEELREISAALASAGANVCLLSPEAITSDVVRYLYARTFCVWCEAEEELNITSAMEIILTGVFAVVSYDTDVLYTAATEHIYENTMTRLPIDIGHRGSVEFAQHNSLEGCNIAEDQGADAVEIDIYVTTDGEIILNHNPTYGSLNIEASTFEQVRTAAPNLPTLREIYEGIERETVIFLEIKSGKPEIVDAIDKLTKEYNYYDKLVIISVNMDQLIRCRELMPQVPCSFLTGDGKSDVNEQIARLRPNNVTLDASHSSGVFMFTDIGIDSNAKAFPIFLWTFTNSASIDDHIILGYLGITTDIPYRFGNLARELESWVVSEGDIVPGKTYEVGYEMLSYDGSEVRGQRLKITSPDPAVKIDNRSVTFEKAGEYTLFVSAVSKTNANIDPNIYTLYDVIHVSVPTSTVSLDEPHALLRPKSLKKQAISIRMAA